MICSPKD
ncbi:Serine/threonine-protein kinase AtPK1/AtPK6 [Zea mays]|nr:Serine/threonine-protein kinase AtPK1/AtPK6 [Zea mays]